MRLWFLVASALLCVSCVYARIFYFNKPTLQAPSYFDNRDIRASDTPLWLPKPKEANFKITESRSKSYRSFDALLEGNQTRAFLVVHDDNVVYERYFDGVTRETLLPSFSISKTYASALIGRALANGVFASLDDPLVKYVPELEKKPGYDQITLEDLLRMVSGIDFTEESTAGAVLYYCTDLREQVSSYDVKWAPGAHYLYGSVNIQLLWEALHARLAGETVAHYFEREFWSPLGAAHSATWSLDSGAQGTEKFFGGFNATLRDHALIGLLFLHGGALNGQRILPRDWVERAVSPDPIAGVVHITDGFVRRGRYQWFLTLDGRAYYAKGYHGQYIFVVPERNAVFVRFGEGYGDVDWISLFLRLADAL